MYKYRFNSKLLFSTSFLFALQFSNIPSSNGFNVQQSLHNPSSLSAPNDWSNGPFQSDDAIMLGGNHAIKLNQPNYIIRYLASNDYILPKITVLEPIKLGYIYPNSNLYPIDLENDVELTFTEPLPASSDYGITQVAPTPSLGSAKGIVNFARDFTSDSSDNNNVINFNLGTPELKLQSVRSISAVTEYIYDNVNPNADPIVVTNYIAGNATLTQGKEIHAVQYELFPETINGSQIKSAQYSLLTLEDDTLVDAKITRRNSPYPFSFSLGSGLGGRTLEAADGSLTVKAGTTLLKEVGDYNNPLYKVIFESNDRSKQVNLYDNIYADYINIAQPTINIRNNVSMVGKIKAENSNINLNANSLYISDGNPNGAVITSDTSPIDPNDYLLQFLGNIEISTTVSDQGHGKIIAYNADLENSADDGITTKIKMNEADSLKILLTDNTTTIPGSEGRTYKLFDKKTNNINENDNAHDPQFDIISDDKVEFFVQRRSTNPFVTWSYSKGILKQKAIPKEQVTKIIKEIVFQSGGDSRTAENAVKIINSPTGAAGDVITVAIADPGGLSDAIQMLDPVIPEATEAAFTAMDESTRTISERISSVSSPGKFKLAQSDEGVSAGNESYKFGSWGSVYYSIATQRGDDKKPGYKSTTVGTALGADTLLNDTTLLGLAVSFMDLKIDHKNTNTGSKTKSNGYLFSLYGLKELTQEWFIQAVVSAGTNKIINKERRRAGLVYQTATGKYNVSSYGTEVIGGYEYLINPNVMLTPMFGMSYARIGSSWYQETGTTNQNLLITKKADRKAEIIAGGRITHSRPWKESSIVAELHGIYRYDLLNISPEVDVRLNGLVEKFESRTREKDRAVYNIGCGINLNQERMEYGITYDGYLAKKYIGHQGTLKLRINF